MEKVTSAPSPSSQTPVGIFAEHGTTYLFLDPQRSRDGQQLHFTLETSEDSFHFLPHAPAVPPFNADRISIVDLRFSQTNHHHLLTYLTHGYSGAHVTIATSEDLADWKILGEVKNIHETAVIVSDFRAHGQSVMFFGESAIRIAYADTPLDWKPLDTPVIAAGTNFYGPTALQPLHAEVTPQGLWLFFLERSHIQDHVMVALRVAQLDPQEPAIVVTPPMTLWQMPDDWVVQNVTCLGMATFHDTLLTYWLVGDTITSILHPYHSRKLSERALPPVKAFLNRLHHNPILHPLVHHFWESRATFNPAAIFEGGKVHLVYRAIGDQDVSVLGYASSRDGLQIDERLEVPIYIPTEHFECSSPYHHRSFRETSSSSPYVSGGGSYGGCEDPRLSRVEDRIYMTYVAYDGWRPPRVALTSIGVEDFLKHEWNWKKPVLISKPNVVDKNACILPEKINGKFVVFHRIFPDILIDFVDSLDFDGTTYLKGEYKISPRPHAWDSRKVGIGAPPIKTSEGWLLIYQAVGDQDAGRYKIGAMLLDLNDPTKVLYRCNQPILEPIEWYENQGHKSGVVYPCGAVIKDDTLIVYYGGADTVVCAATANLPEFLHQLKSTGRPTLQLIQRGTNPT